MKGRAKTFMFVCIGLLALTLAYVTGSQMAVADVAPSGNIHAINWDELVLTTSGECWHWSDQNGWLRTPDYDAPVPVSDIVMWQGQMLVTSSGDVWCNPGTGWVLAGDPQDGVRTHDTSWSQLKAAYQSDK